MLLEAYQLKYYIQDRLLLEVDKLHIYNHDRIGVVGRNGSGKTTLFNILADAVVPEQGTVIHHGGCELLPQLKKADPLKSGGEVTQRYINEVLMNAAPLLIADEPTTHLDQAHIEWLEKKLLQWEGAYVIASHDRAFLDALCTTIWEVNEGKVNVYKGNYSEYAKQKELELRQRQAAYEQYETKKQQLEEAIALRKQRAERAVKVPKKEKLAESNSAVSKPYYAKKQKTLQKSAKALESRIAKLEKVEKVKEAAPLKMNVLDSETIKDRIILRIQDVSAIIPQRVLWNNANFHIRSGEKVAIIGPNGCGKTTLLNMILNQEQGIRLSPSIKLGYFSQHLNILNTAKTVIDNVRSTSNQDETTVRTVLARMHFYRDDVYKPVEVLSGGERVKVALAKVFLSECNTLLLDEPTNFLDIEAVTALESLLKEYEGTVIFVSHDRRMIENVANRLVIIQDQKLHWFEGSFPEYLHTTENKQQQRPDPNEDQRLLLETKITEVLSRLSIEPSEALEEEFQQLLAEKRKLDLT